MFISEQADRSIVFTLNGLLPHRKYALGAATRGRRSFVFRGSADESNALYLPHDPDYGGDRRGTLGGRDSARQMASAAVVVDVCARTRARLLRAGTFCRSYGYAIRND